jgi:hypothetical protein
MQQLPPGRRFERMIIHIVRYAWRLLIAIHDIVGTFHRNRIFDVHATMAAAERGDRITL